MRDERSYLIPVLPSISPVRYTIIGRFAAAQSRDAAAKVRDKTASAVRGHESRPHPRHVNCFRCAGHQ